MNLTTSKQQSFTVIDLFAGAGGTGVGFQQAGFNLLCAVEIDPYAAETYEKNLKVPVKRVDIRKLDPKDLRKELGLKKGELSVLIGCPPCQGFSRMRNEKGEGDERNNLLEHYLEYLEEFKPCFALFENVPGLIRSKHGKVFFQTLLAGLKSHGYEYVERLVDAADYGVPQHRKRILVVAGRDEIPPFPKPTHGPAQPASLFDNGQYLKPWITVRDAIAKFPPLEAGENGEQEDSYSNHIAPIMGPKVKKFISHVPKDGGSRTDVPSEFWLRCHSSTTGFNDVYGRMYWDRPSNTLTTGCTNVSKGRYVHPEQDRAITPREAAALQGFPDDFKFFKFNASAQIGNAVPPPLARAVAETLMRKILSDSTFETKLENILSLEQVPA